MASIKYCVDCHSKYTVKAGDSLGSIAAAHQTTVEALLQANPSITNPDQIWAGQQLCIPAPLDPGELEVNCVCSI